MSRCKQLRMLLSRTQSGLLSRVVLYDGDDSMQDWRANSLRSKAMMIQSKLYPLIKYRHEQLLNKVLADKSYYDMGD